MNRHLDEYLCKKYPKIFSGRHKPMTETAMCWGFDCGDGWFFLIDQLCNSIQTYIDDSSRYDTKENELPIHQVVATQVKEKFGGLRFYVIGGDAYTGALIDFAESLSCRICEDCGRTDELVARGGQSWIRTTCPEHSKNKEFHMELVDQEYVDLWNKVRNDAKV